MTCVICKFRHYCCVCDHTYWDHFDDDFSQYTKYMKENHNNNELILHPLSLSTTTFNFKLKHIGINFDVIQKYWEPSLFINSIKNNSKGKKSKNVDTNKRMYNTIICSGYLKVDSKRVNKILIRLFHTGAIGISGCKTLDQNITCMHKILRWLKSFPISPFIYNDIYEYTNVPKMNIILTKGKQVITRTDLQRIRMEYRPCKDKKMGSPYSIELKYENKEKEYITDIKNTSIEHNTYTKTGKIKKTMIYDAKMSMVNATFRVKCGLKLSKLNEILKNSYYSIHNKGPIIDSEYGGDSKKNYIYMTFVPTKNNPFDITLLKETRRRNLRYPNQMTVSIYGTGSILIIGGKRSNDFFEVYNFLIDIIQTNEIIKKKQEINIIDCKKHYDYTEIDINTKILVLRHRKLNDLFNLKERLVLNNSFFKIKNV